LGAVHQPDRYVAAGVMPENIAFAVSVEIPGAYDRPRGGDGPDTGRLRHLRAVEEPHRHIAAGVVPEPVVLAVAVEVALTDEGPCSRYRAQTLRLLQRRAIQQPDRCVAAGVAPRDVTLAVTIEVVGAGGERVTKRRPRVVPGFGGKRVYCSRLGINPRPCVASEESRF